MRILGGMAALMICLLWGWSKAWVLRTREDLMSAFSADIQALAAEMEYRPRDIRNMAEKLSAGRLGGFWQEFADGIADSQSAELSWQQAAEVYDGFAMLSREEYSLITEAGRSIGQRNTEDSVKSLKHWSSEAVRRADELREESRNKGAVYQKLGLLGGLAVMLLIV